MKNNQFFEKIWEKVVVHRYVSIGLHWGDLTSYGFLGEPYGYGSICEKLEFWESKYRELGYTVIDRDVWVGAGGYGKDYESHLRRLTND